MDKRIMALSMVVMILTSALLHADDKKSLEMKIILKKDAYELDTHGKTPKEFKAMLEEFAAAVKNKAKADNPPRPPEIDLELQIKNTGRQDVTIYLGGNPNFYTLELKGPSVIDVKPRLAFPAIYRLPRAVTLAPGKTHDIPVKALSDGPKLSRWIYWSEPGEYTIAATYQLSGPKGEKDDALTSEPVKIKVELKK